MLPPNATKAVTSDTWRVTVAKAPLTCGARIPVLGRRAAGSAGFVPASSATAARLAVLHQHLGTLGLTGVLEAFPPLAERRIELAALAAQQHEIVARAKTRVLEQPVRA